MRRRAFLKAALGTASTLILGAPLLKHAAPKSDRLMDGVVAYYPQLHDRSMVVADGVVYRESCFERLLSNEEMSRLWNLDLSKEFEVSLWVRP